MTTRTELVQTKMAKLTSSGFNYRKWTRHTYAYSEVVRISRPRGENIVGLAHVFKCSETGELRRWGFDVTFAKDNGGN